MQPRGNPSEPQDRSLFGINQRIIESALQHQIPEATAAGTGGRRMIAQLYDRRATALGKGGATGSKGESHFAVSAPYRSIRGPRWPSGILIGNGTCSILPPAFGYTLVTTYLYRGKSC